MDTHGWNRWENSTSQAEAAAPTAVADSDDEARDFLEGTKSAAKFQEVERVDGKLGVSEK